MRSVSPISLWHGTCSALLPSILEHGLGGRNIIADLKAVEFIKTAVDLIGPVTLEDDPDTWLFLGLATKISAQVSDHMNWRHGSVYVSASKYQAASYAMNSPEAVDTCRTLFRILRQREMGHRADCLLSEFEELSHMLYAPWYPIVIELPGVPCEALLPEVDHGNRGNLSCKKETRDTSPCATLTKLKESSMPIEVCGQGTNFILNTVWKTVPHLIESVSRLDANQFDFVFNAIDPQEKDRASQ